MQHSIIGRFWSIIGSGLDAGQLETYPICNQCQKDTSKKTVIKRKRTFVQTDSSTAKRKKQSTVSLVVSLYSVKYWTILVLLSCCIEIDFFNGSFDKNPCTLLDFAHFLGPKTNELIARCNYITHVIGYASSFPIKAYKNYQCCVWLYFR